MPSVVEYILHASGLRALIFSKVSFLQIYNERIYDLLNPAHLRAMKDDTATAGLRLRWSPLQQFHVENLFVYEYADSLNSQLAFVRP